MNQAHDYNNHLPSKLRLALWKRIDRHLQKGEVLITNEQFFKVMDREFVRLVKVRPSPKIRQALYEMIVHVNDQYSDKYMAFGIRNAVKSYLGQLLDRLEHDAPEAIEIDSKVRERVSEKLRAAVDYSVHFINAFEGLKRLPPERDGVLKTLIFHKHLVMADNLETDMGPLIGDLEADEEALESLSKIIERRDHEARMLSANLPPYRYVMGQGKIGNLVIEENFVKELRTLERAELSDRLNSGDQATRVKPAADIRCMVALLSQIIELTPAHLAIRRLIIRQIITKLYSSMSDGKNGRQKVSHFLGQRMPRLFPNMSAEETAAISEECEQVMAGIDAEREKSNKKDEMRVYRV